MGYRIGARGPEWQGGSTILAAPQPIAAPLQVQAAPHWVVGSTLQGGAPLLWTVASPLQKNIQGALLGWLGVSWWEGSWLLEVQAREQTVIAAYRVIWRARLVSCKGQEERVQRIPGHQQQRAGLAKGVREREGQPEWLLQQWKGLGQLGCHWSPRNWVKRAQFPRAFILYSENSAGGGGGKGGLPAKYVH